MRIEIGKYYKNRRGEFVGPVQDNPTDCSYPFQTVMFGTYRSYTSEGRYYSDDEDPNDLVEECNADGSPVVPVEPPTGLSWNVPADRSWRDEIALRVLPGLLSLGSDLEDADLPNGTQGEIAVKQAFYIADVFLKAAKQS